MPEPVTLVVGGIALYAFLKAKNVTPVPTPAQVAASPASATAGLQPINADVSGTGPDAPTATETGTVNQQEAGVSIGNVMQQPELPVPTEYLPPADLVAALDNDTALAMRAYARLNPADFEMFLDRYADRIVLRNDMVIERLIDPPGADPMQPSMGMLVGMGNAAYKVVQAINGVAVGKSVDVFGLGASVAGQIPGVNQDFVSSLQALAMGYRAISSISQVMSIAAANQVGVTTMMSWGSGSLSAVGAYPGLAALPIAGVLMAVGLVVDIGFTIIGDKPDLQKAIDVALDVASLAVLFIPVIGIVIAIIIQLVKFIIDLFGEDLFGGGMSKEQKEAIEMAKYLENLNPMFPELANAYTPREMFKTIIAWGSGYCGGKHVVAMSVNLKLKAGDQLLVGGSVFTVPPDPAVEAYYGDGTSLLLGFGDNEQPGKCYWLQSTPFANITNDEQALALGAYASVNGVVAGAQVGVSESAQVQAEDPIRNLIMARTQPMHDFIVKHRLGLDQIDTIAAEYRAQPHLNELARAFGWPTWQEMFGSLVDVEWFAFSSRVANGSLTDFARQNGYPTMYAYRAAALAPYEELWSKATTLIAGLKSRKAMWESYAEQLAAQTYQQQYSAP